MQKPLAVATLAVLLSPAFLAIAQTVSPAPAAPGAPPEPVRASTLLQPSINSVVTVLNALKLDKWKKGSVREEAGQNVESILRDIQNNLPPLMGAADAAPDSVSAAMPLVKHLDALYDVLLRVEEASRVAAPSEQISQLQDALTVFGAARFALDDALQKQAAVQEKQVSDLRVALVQREKAAAEAAAHPAAAKPCATPATAAHRKVRRRTAKKPHSTTTSQKPSPAKPQ
ncbi:MAG: hypothetical protein ACLGSD_04535 [Acidobacteriota bacterium]